INSFWGDIKSSFDANLIICEFKNYSEKLNSNTLFNATKYLNNKNGFILIFTRFGLDDSAKKHQIKLLRDNKILILVLTDFEVIQMINERNLNIDPTYRLESMRFELEKL